MQGVHTVSDEMTLLQQSTAGWLESKVAGLVVSQAEIALQ
jgi:hypothetical protein